MRRTNPATLEKGDLFVSTFEGYDLTRGGYQRSHIDGYDFMTLFDLREPPAGVKNWRDAIGKLVVFEYDGPAHNYSRPAAEIRVVVGPNEARTYGRWGGREEDLFALERREGRGFERPYETIQRESDEHFRQQRATARNNPALPPFEPVEVEQIRADMQAAIGAVAERYGLRVQYSELAPNEKTIPVGFKLTRRAPQQKDLFGNPGSARARESNPRAVRIGRRISGT